MSFRPVRRIVALAILASFSAACTSTAKQDDPAVTVVPPLESTATPTAAIEGVPTEPGTENATSEKSPQEAAASAAEQEPKSLKSKKPARGKKKKKRGTV